MLSEGYVKQITIVLVESQGPLYATGQKNYKRLTLALFVDSIKSTKLVMNILATLLNVQILRLAPFYLGEAARTL